MRDYLDFRFAWPFLYPMSQASAERLLKWPMTSSHFSAVENPSELARAILATE
jgi:hypothetical protein